MANATLLVNASLRNGSYGGGTTPDVNTPSNDPSQTCPGIVNSSDGVAYTDNRALINWHFTDAVADTLRYAGTISFTATFHSGTFTGTYPYLLSDNKGYATFANGQSSFATWATVGGDGKVMLAHKYWVNNIWYPFAASTGITFDQPHSIGFAWGRTNNTLEIWVDGQLVSTGSFPAGVVLPWGMGLDTSYPWVSGVNIGLGGNHQRGTNYGSAVGVTFADLKIWNEYRSLGDTANPASVPIHPWTIAVLLLVISFAGYKILGKTTAIRASR